MNAHTPTTDSATKSAIEKAAEGVIYVSESDYPFTYVSADLGADDGEVTEELVREKLRSFVDDDENADKPLKDLFGMEGAWSKWKSDYVECDPNAYPGPEECKAMRGMDEALDMHLSGIKIFYFGSNGEPGRVDGVAVTIFIVGRTAHGNLAGVKTIAIWT